MERLKKALKLRKAKYTKRTGSPGNYKYQYGPQKGKDRYSDIKDISERRKQKEPDFAGMRATRDEMRRRSKKAKARREETAKKEREGAETEKKMVNILFRDLNSGQRVRLEGKSGVWKYQGNFGGDHRFKKYPYPVGRIGYSENNLILRGGSAKMRIIRSEE